MATTLIDNFSLYGDKPNFARDRVADTNEMLNVDVATKKYDYGHIVFCVEDGKHYRFMYNYTSPPNDSEKDAVTGWFKELVTGGNEGSIDTSDFATKIDLESKQDVIGDLAAIRSGAAKGATAVQEIEIVTDEPITTPSNGRLYLGLAIVAKSGSYNDLNTKPEFKTINGVSIVKSDENDSGNIEITGGDGSVDLSGYVTDAELTEVLKLKVDAVEGKGLSTNDFTTTLKNKLDGIASGAEVNVQSDWNATSGDAFIKNKPTIPTTLSQLTQSASHRTVTDEEKSTWDAKLDKNTADNSYLGKNDKAASATNADNATNDGNGNNISNTYATKEALSDELASKQDVIDDLENIREKASAAFTGSINGTKDGSFMFADKVNINGNTKKVNSEGTIELGDYATLDDLNSKVDKVTLATVATSGSYNDLTDKPSIPAEQVNADWNATSGKAQILNKPSIPAAVTESTVSGWGFTKNTGDYSKPTDGIPQSDLADNVNELLTKAGKAFTGTVNYKSEGPVVAIEKIIMNNKEYTPEGSETHVDLGVVAPAYAEYTGTSTAVEVTTKYGIFPTTAEGLVEGVRVAVKIEGALTLIKTLNVNGTGEKNVYYNGNSLSSGTIKQYNTYEFIYDGSYYRIIGINTDTNTHYTAMNVVGASSSAKANAAATNGNVHLNLVENSTVMSSHSISGAGSVSVESDAAGNMLITGTSAYALVNHGTDDTTFTLTPNTFHVWGIVSSLTLTFGSETEGVANEYLFQFTAGSGGTTLSLPAGIIWAGGAAPSIEAFKTYQISVLNSCATYLCFE